MYMTLTLRAGKTRLGYSQETGWFINTYETSTSQRVIASTLWAKPCPDQYEQPLIVEDRRSALRAAHKRAYRESVCRSFADLGIGLRQDFDLDPWPVPTVEPCAKTARQLAKRERRDARRSARNWRRGMVPRRSLAG